MRDIFAVDGAVGGFAYDVTVLPCRKQQNDVHVILFVGIQVGPTKSLGNKSLSLLKKLAGYGFPRSNCGRLVCQYAEVYGYQIMH